MPTLAEKIEAVVREAFHDGWLELDDVSERLLLTLCRSAANLAIVEAALDLERLGMDFGIELLQSAGTLHEKYLEGFMAGRDGVVERIRVLALSEGKS